MWLLGTQYADYDLVELELQLVEVVFQHTNVLRVHSRIDCKRPHFILISRHALTVKVSHLLAYLLTDQTPRTYNRFIIILRDDLNRLLGLEI